MSWRGASMITSPRVHANCDVVTPRSSRSGMSGSARSPRISIPCSKPPLRLVDEEAVMLHEERVQRNDEVDAGEEDPFLSEDARKETDEENREAALSVRVAKSSCEEATIIIKFAVPVALSMCARTLQDITDQLILSHLGTIELGAASTATIWTWLFDSFLFAAIGQTSTLCAQAFGAGNYRLCGEWLQLSLTCFTVLLIPIVGARWFTADILKAIGFDAALAEMAGTYTLYSQLSIVFDVVFMSTREFFAAQGVVKPAMCVEWICVFVNAGVAYAFVFEPLQLGLVGAALATSAVRVFRTLLFCAYCFSTSPLVRSGESFRCRWWWGAVSAWKRWAQLLGLAVPAGLGQLLEETQFQALAFLAAKMGPAAISAQNLTFSLLNFFWLFGGGVGEAVGLRVGGALGAGQIASAKRTSWVGILMTTVMGCLLGASLLVVGKPLFDLTSKDPKVVELMVGLVPYSGACIALLLDLGPLFCIMQKQGRVTLASLTFALCAWGVGFPLSFFLRSSMGLEGLWLGLITGYAVASVVLVLLIATSNWEKLSADAKKRSEARGTHAAGDAPGPQAQEPEDRDGQAEEAGGMADEA